MWLARRFAGDVPTRVAVLLALLPLLFTGKAVLRGMLYGPSDLYTTDEPWRAGAEARGAAPPANVILSDLAYANLPWRAAVRESLSHGRLPFWNRFVLAGTPLLGTAQAGVLHPATWLGLWLPVPLSYTFSCTFTIFLALLAAWLFFADFGLPAGAAAVGAVGWGFSTYVLFWVGWSVGPSIATFPLLLLGLRRLAVDADRAAIGLTTAALWLSFCGGHPETFFHATAAGGVYFLWELAGRRGAPTRANGFRAVGGALGAGLLALLLSGPQLAPLLEAIPHSAEYRARRQTAGRSSQSVSLPESARRLLPDLLPFAHGIYGRSRVESSRSDGSGAPLGYAGAVLFPLALLGLGGRPAIRGRGIFLTFFVAGLAYGASAPGLHDLTARLPGFSLALNYRLVFLAGIGLSGLAALGLARVDSDDGARRLAVACPAVAALLVTAFFLARPVFADRSLPQAFLGSEFLYELSPVVLLGVVAAVSRGRSAGATPSVAVALLAAQRFLEMRGQYPTLPASSLAPPLAGLEVLKKDAAPARLVAADATFRPNGPTLYGLEDVRGYESLVLDRFADTYPLWCVAQPASFNLVTDLSRPFLGLLNARYAIGAPSGPEAPPGWRLAGRTADMTVFENPAALPRAFVPRRLRRTAEASRLSEMAAQSDFASVAWLSADASGPPPGDEENGEARLVLREAGPDLLVSADASRRAFVATSLPDWPGWRALDGAAGVELPLETVDHAFVGFWLPPGQHAVRLTYRPRSWTFGLAAFAAGLLASFVMAATARRRPA